MATYRYGAAYEHSPSEVTQARQPVGATLEMSLNGKTQERHLTANDLTHDGLVEILARLDIPSIRQVARVSKLWNQAAQDAWWTEAFGEQNRVALVTMYLGATDIVGDTKTRFQEAYAQMIPDMTPTVSTALDGVWEILEDTLKMHYATQFNTLTWSEVLRYIRFRMAPENQHLLDVIADMSSQALQKVQADLIHMVTHGAFGDAHIPDDLDLHDLPDLIDAPIGSMVHTGSPVWPQSGGSYVTASPEVLALWAMEESSDSESSDSYIGNKPHPGGRFDDELD